MQKILTGVLIFLIAVSAIGQTGGGYNLEQNVIGNGGWRSQAGGFLVLGTMGQSNAGSTASGGGFHLIDGLWATEDQTSNSPFAGVGGRITQRIGVGIPRVLVTLTSQTTGLSYQVWSQAQGYYSFAEVPTGSNYWVTAHHRRFSFEPETRSVFVSQTRNDVDFVSDQ